MDRVDAEPYFIRHGAVERLSEDEDFFFFFLFCFFLGVGFVVGVTSLCRLTTIPMRSCPYSSNFERGMMATVVRFEGYSIATQSLSPHADL